MVGTLPPSLVELRRDKSVCPPYDFIESYLMPDISKPRIALLGIPLEIGASQAGTLMGPAALRTAGIGRLLDQLGFGVEDHGDMAFPGVAPAGEATAANAKYYDEIKGWIRALSARSYMLAQ